ncbi:penicillin-binding transpeptidase domain-containing protein [Dietzia psychralcaliphila]|uniref:Penicillin-binding protein n=1 Tax=Dietzia psychralcaliphila TaxID=139021 RepID=A0AAD0JP00_9ACTN|nr:penicillin-binding transpeptidase domain-containing protein [Dietzia psychralcaliphila]AWH94194.1 penicillin-binding protein [Dietzia psychralcaliphila]PTM89777.1 cell elongation-specific peptidoglycan D,D-transpeptidase [Dietzia psychralcaliphila]
MNAAIRRVAIAAMVMVVALLLQLTWVQVFRADELRADPRNTRMLLDEYSRQRGQITAGGRVLAMSVHAGGRYEFERTYPTSPTAFGPTIGYYSLQFATSGIEQSQDAFLNGSDPRLLSQRISGLISGRTPQGGSVELTLDPVAQDVAYGALQRGAGQGPFVGSVAAVRPSTGEVLALASSPSFDPNALSSQEQTVRTQEMGRIEQSPDRPLLNHATQQSLPPGSTMKVITTAAALESGMGPDTPVSGADRTLLPGTSTYLQNYAGQTCGGGTVTLRTAFELSCNVPFVELSQEIGSESFTEMAERFGVDGSEPEELGIPAAPSGLGQMDDAAQLAMSSIGQSDVRMTTLQNAMVAATVSNGGVRMQPQLIRSLTAPDLSVVQGFTPEDAGRALTDDQAGTLTELMEGAERNAGGGLPGVTIASKTGTAEHGVDADESIPYTWYIAFVPGQDVAVAVAIESGPGITRDTVGSTYAAPIGREVLGALLGGGG